MEEADLESKNKDLVLDMSNLRYLLHKIRCDIRDRKMKVKP